MDYFVITFNTINDALLAEKLLSAHGGTLIPVFPELSGGCGFAAKLPELEPGISIIKEKIMPDGIYKVSGRGKSRVVEKL